MQVRRGKDGRPLSEEERALWNAVAKSVRRNFRSPSAPSAERPVLNRRTDAIEETPSVAPKRVLRPLGAVEPSTTMRRAASPIDPLGRTTPGLDRRTSRRLSRGEQRPDAKLDLHGMTAERAHVALIGFIRGQFASGARCVLVITGKGGRGDGALEGWRSERVGVLKTMAPEWLRQPPIGGLVTGVFQAHRRHGGDGALYVYLRKNR